MGARRSLDRSAPPPGSERTRRRLSQPVLARLDASVGEPGSLPDLPPFQRRREHLLRSPSNGESTGRGRPPASVRSPDAGFAGQVDLDGLSFGSHAVDLIHVTATHRVVIRGLLRIFVASGLDVARAGHFRAVQKSGEVPATTPRRALPTRTRQSLPTCDGVLLGSTAELWASRPGCPIHRQRRSKSGFRVTTARSCGSMRKRTPRWTGRSAS